MRTTYLLPCECGENIRVTSVQAGETVQCSSCGAELTAPPFREMQNLELADPKKRRRREKGWDRRKICMMVGLYLTAGALIILAIVWARRPQSVDFSAFSPFESWQAWMELRQGLQRRVSWFTYYMVESRKQLRLTTYVCVGTALFGIALSLSAFIMRKKRARI